VREGKGAKAEMRSEVVDIVVVQERVTDSAAVPNGWAFGRAGNCHRIFGGFSQSYLRALDMTSCGNPATEQDALMTRTFTYNLAV